MAMTLSQMRAAIERLRADNPLPPPTVMHNGEPCYVIRRSPQLTWTALTVREQYPPEPLLNPAHPQWEAANQLMYEISRVDPPK